MTNVFPQLYWISNSTKSLQYRHGKLFCLCCLPFPYMRYTVYPASNLQTWWKRRHEWQIAENKRLKDMILSDCSNNFIMYYMIVWSIRCYLGKEDGFNPNIEKKHTQAKPGLLVWKKTHLEEELEVNIKSIYSNGVPRSKQLPWWVIHC